MDRRSPSRGPWKTVLTLVALTPVLTACGRQDRQAADAPVLTITIGGSGATGNAPDLIGIRPGEWKVTEWINSEPLRLEELRGKVVLVRWFMDPSCPDCSATAAALREFDELYRDAGLAVIGMFHNSDQPLDEVREIVREYGYTFPVAIDRQTATRHAWCRGGDDCGYSDPYRSATLLLDRRGVIQHAHHQGRYVKGDYDFERMQAEIERLLFDETRLEEIFSGDRHEPLTDVERRELESLAQASERVVNIQIERFSGERPANGVSSTSTTAVDD